MSGKRVFPPLRASGRPLPAALVRRVRKEFGDPYADAMLAGDVAEMQKHYLDTAPGLAEEWAKRRAAERGAWFAIDAVLAWINTQTEQVIDKKELYKAVMRMRPATMAALNESPPLE